ncbi:MAG: penicillin-binding protein 1C [Methylotenera sp.]|nr:penicillin-binding protein 1C [Methylotenera sp.]
MFKNRFLAAFVLFLLPAFAIALPTFESVKNNYQASDSWLLARDGQVLQQIRINHQIRRLQWTPIEDVSPALLQALLYSEDKRFYEHAGVDWQAITATSWRNLWQKKTRGASTLTMQLAGILDEENRNSKRNILQKTTQIAQALQLDNQWKKDEILEAYLNQVSFRGELQGVAAMSFGLFNKAPSALNARDAAIAAVLIRAPNANAAKVTERACVLLKQMQQAQFCAALDGYVSLKLQGPFEITLQNQAPHLARKLIDSANQKVKTSIDANLQRFATQQLRANLMQLEHQNVQDGAVIVLDNQTGQVLTWVGSSGSLSSAPDVDSVTAARQAGSTLKPFLYGVAIQQKALTAASILDDSPVRIATPSGYYVPQNYDQHFVGPVSMRRALGSSLNVPAVRTLLNVGGDQFYAALQTFGFSTMTESADYYGYSLALGAADVRLLDLTNAYRALANGGLWQPISFTKSKLPPFKPTYLKPAVSFIVSDILADNSARYLTFGLDSTLHTPYWTAVKTGTSKDMRDNWCIGYSGQYTVGVWVGNAGGEPMHDVSGVTGAAPIWRAVMDKLHAGNRFQPKLPATVEARQIRYMPDLEPARRELFIAGTGQNVIVANQHTAQLISHTKLINNKSSAQKQTLARIAYPGEGTIIALDPEIPVLQQKIVFKTNQQQVNNRYQWRLNGANFNQAAWQPGLGRHRLELLNDRHQVIDTIHFEIRGAFLKVSTKPPSH